jgi:hypothetical protein
MSEEGWCTGREFARLVERTAAMTLAGKAGMSVIGGDPIAGWTATGRWPTEAVMPESWRALSPRYRSSHVLLRYWPAPRRPGVMFLTNGW